MEPISTPLSVIRNSADRSIKRIENKSEVSLELCRIEEVYEDKGTVTIYLFDSNRFSRNVPYCFPMYNAGYGIMFTPMKGSLGIASKDSRGSIRILCFLAPDMVDKEGAVTRNLPFLGKYNLPKMREGEMMLKSPEGASIYLDKEGNININSAAYALIRLNSEGDMDLDAEKILQASKCSVEKIYDDDYNTYLEIKKGKHDYFPIQEQDSSIELCYSVTLKNEETVVFFFGIDMEGNIHKKKTNIIEY